MEHHVFAVWDFMSLLKALQRQLCCVSIPWSPSDNSLGCRFINEIVLGEESDEDGHGGYASHFELYRGAMARFGASTKSVDRLLTNLRAGLSLQQALNNAEVSQPIQRFIGHTFEVIEAGDPCRLASEFTFGREDLLPDIFQRIVDEIDRETSGDWPSSSITYCGTSNWTVMNTGRWRLDLSLICAATILPSGRPPKMQLSPRSNRASHYGTRLRPAWREGLIFGCHCQLAWQCLKHFASPLSGLSVFHRRLH